MQYFEVFISAENQEQAHIILNSLLEKKLVTGGQCIASPARFWWKGQIQDMAEYITITSFTTEAHKDAIIADVKLTSVEEVPMIRFSTIECNKELLEWIAQTVA